MNTSDTVIEKKSSFAILRDAIYFHELPSYANRIFYGLGFLALVSLATLIFSGIVMAFMGPSWWLTIALGVYTRSVHLWAVQAFIAILIIHMLVAFFTSAYRPPHRMVWVFGSIIFCLALIQSEFGFALRGDFSSQYRVISGADFWNGAHLGWWVNPLNFAQDLALHTAIIPILIIVFFLMHYIIEHSHGISKPYSADVSYTMVPANHRIMYIRGAVLMVGILGMAALFPSPYVKPLSVADIASQDPTLLTQTLMQEFDYSSGTATYLDSINPYTYDIRKMYVGAPYKALVATSAAQSDAWAQFTHASKDEQSAYIEDAQQYFAATDTVAVVAYDTQSGVGKEQQTTLTLNDELDNPAAAPALISTSTNPVTTMILALVPSAQSGAYEAYIAHEGAPGDNTIPINFVRDTGVLDAEAAAVHITTEEWGMVREETGSITRLPPGAWWFSPIGILNSTILKNDDNGDRDAAWILFGVMILFVTFPFIPLLNKLPEKLGVARFLWHS